MDTQHTHEKRKCEKFLNSLRACRLSNYEKSRKHKPVAKCFVYEELYDKCKKGKNVYFTGP
jgi:hypothetical protein